MAWVRPRAAGIGLAGAAVALWVHPESAFYPACPIYNLLHVRCPGCGGTRAVAALLHGRLGEAWGWNGLVVAALPLVLGYLAVAYRRGDWPRLPGAVVFGGMGVAVGFAVARNVGGF